nr:EamA domain, WAT1-related protein [Tanacetum cinerariifolium]
MEEVNLIMLVLFLSVMNDGFSTIVFIVYQNFLRTLILLPFFIFHIFRNVERPPLTFHLLLRFFILGLLGLCIGQVLMYAGVYYSSPTMRSDISNLGPANTFLLVIIFRMEKEINSSSSQAKLLGTITVISGAMVITFYQGPRILKTIMSPDSSNHLLLSQPSDWIIGGLILVIAGVISSIWGVLQVLNDFLHSTKGEVRSLDSRLLI